MMIPKTIHRTPLRLAFASAVLLSAVITARAADGPWSLQGAIGAGPARIDIRCDVESADCDRESLAKRLSFVAVHPSRWGAELAYERSDDYQGSQVALLPFTGRADISSLSIAALYRFGSERLPMQVRLGIARTRTEFTYLAGGSGNVELDTWQPLAGFVLDIPLSRHLALRWDAHATRARIADHASVIGAVTLGLAIHF
jgi:hypothetical protein